MKRHINIELENQKHRYKISLTEVYCMQNHWAWKFATPPDYRRVQLRTYRKASCDRRLPK